VRSLLVLRFLGFNECVRNYGAYFVLGGEGEKIASFLNLVNWQFVRYVEYVKYASRHNQATKTLLGL